MEDGKREIESESERLALGTCNHKVRSGEQSAASGKREGADGFRYHEVKHRHCEQWKGKVGN